MTSLIVPLLVGFVVRAVARNALFAAAIDAVRKSLRNGPTKENDTMVEVRRRAKLEEEREGKGREREERLELRTKRLKKRETELLAKIERRKRLEEAAWRKIAEEKRDLEEQEKELQEKKLQEAKEEEEKKQARQRAAEQIFGSSLRWPTDDEINSASKRTNYNTKNFHFAIVGRAGSGKSSLINAFINRSSGSIGAARTDAIETTLEIGRYPDPGTEAPRNKIVWFDVPGADTQRVPQKDYFIRQGLFTFDLILLTIGDCFEEIDVRIIMDCAWFKTPLFIVRSKADMHILNMAKERDEDYERISDDPELYKKCRDMFIEKTQRSVTKGLEMERLKMEELMMKQGPKIKGPEMEGLGIKWPQDQKVYIVSRRMLRRTYNSAPQVEGQGKEWPDSLKHDQAMIHEMDLVTDLLAAAVRRRTDME